MGKSVCAHACVVQRNWLTAISFCHSLHKVPLSPTGPSSTAAPNKSNLKPTLEASVGTASQSATAPLEYRKDPFPWQKFVPKSWKQHGKVLMLASERTVGSSRVATPTPPCCCSSVAAAAAAAFLPHLNERRKLRGYAWIP